MAGGARLGMVVVVPALAVADVADEQIIAAGVAGVVRWEPQTCVTEFTDQVMCQTRTVRRNTPQTRKLTPIRSASSVVPPAKLANEARGEKDAPGCKQTYTQRQFVQCAIETIARMSRA